MLDGDWQPWQEQPAEHGHGIANIASLYWPNVLLQRCVSVNMNIDKNIAITANQCHNQCLRVSEVLCPVTCTVYTVSKYIFTKIICHWLFDSSTKIEQAEV